ncbi:MAG: hypothetical protein M1825_004416 [Sarcosagium campestre]|nr:MAG: hypothetical protein M1825_004416 [Sarcosagium campestre]
MDVFWQAPPVARTLAAAALITSLVAYAGILNPTYLVWYWPYVWKFPPEIWRGVTCFFITNPKLDIIFDTYFIFTYGSGLEKGSSRFAEPGSFFTYILYICGLILSLNAVFFDGAVLTQALIIALTYTYAQDNLNKKATIIVVTVPMAWLPYSMLLITMIRRGPDQALRDGLGIIAAHSYDFLTRIYPTFGGGRNCIRTPQAVQRWFRAGGPRVINRSYGSAIRQSVDSQPSRATSNGFSSSFGGGSGLWGTRGSGRRLGGD